jgi:DNA-binding Lrp family transcriptional regulator
MIDRDKTDESLVEALIEVRVTPQRDRGFDEIARRIYRFPEVRSVYLMSGGYDLMVLAEGKTLKQVAFFVAEKLSTIEGVISTATHFVLKKYKEDGVVFDEESDSRLAVTP